MSLRSPFTIFVVYNIKRTLTKKDIFHECFSKPINTYYSLYRRRLVTHFISALPTILLIIGILIGLPSLYALLIYLLSEDRNKLPFPVLSLVVLLFGCTLMLFPGWYIGITVYVLGGALVLIGVYQILYLLTLKKNLRSKAGWLSYLLPAIVLLIGIEILVNPFSATERVMVITFGAATLLYGITDLIYYIRLK